MAICGIILDVDGTLVDSNDAHARAWQATLREFGYDISYEKARGLVGMGGDNYLPNAVGVKQDSKEGKAISEARTERFKLDYLPHLQPFPQVRELVQALRDAGVKVVVATSGKKEEMQPLLELAHVADLIDDFASANDAESSKPDPDLVHVALKKLGCRPEDTLMLGDTPYDIEAASKAGVRTIALRSGGFDDEALKGAAALYDDAADLLAQLKTSFIYR